MTEGKRKGRLEHLESGQEVLGSEGRGLQRGVKPEGTEGEVFKDLCHID